MKNYFTMTNIFRLKIASNAATMNCMQQTVSIDARQHIIVIDNR